jgi:uncharacterized protein (TIGR02646 family)
MRWIDFEDKKPTDDFPGWEPWTEDEWQAWLDTSKDLLAQVKATTEETEGLLKAGDSEGCKEKIKARNEFMSSKSSHWSKLKPWLLALSHGKCWFSESKDVYSDYHVEHFRPKSEAKDLDGTKLDGYWWLAFDYSNYRICGSVGNSKKGGWFPLRTGSMRSCYTHRCEESESPYLLDPTNPADVELLAFDEEGSAIPAPGTNEWDEQRVGESIKRLKLNEHEALTEARRDIWQKVVREADGFDMARSRCVTGPNPAAEQKMRSHARTLKAMAREDAQLSAVVRWCLSFRNDSHLLRLAY